MTTPARQLEEAVQRSMEAVAKAMAPLAPRIDAQPGGMDAVVLVAMLRAYADLLSEEWGPTEKLIASGVQQRLVEQFKQPMPSASGVEP